MSKLFIPFEDEWDALSRLGTSALVPYRIEYRYPAALPPHHQPSYWHPFVDVVEDAVMRAG